ncbi:hypothetical protein [Candidatus Tokpelaia sp.]|nr:hypothetical protein [Candidatus Tokpelaia sp.]
MTREPDKRAAALSEAVLRLYRQIKGETVSFQDKYYANRDMEY